MNKSQMTNATVWQRLYRGINELYNGSSRRSRYFRWSLLVFDSITILYFIVASFFHHVDDLHVVEEAIGVLYLLEFMARLFISSQRLHHIFNPVGLADLIVIASLLAPSLAENCLPARDPRAAPAALVSHDQQPAQSVEIRARP
jgi:voltage-gated potassium channel